MATTAAPTAPTFTSGPGVFTTGLVWTADCGCTIEGRFVSTRDCTRLDQATATGSQRSRHIVGLRRHLPKETR